MTSEFPKVGVLIGGMFSNYPVTITGLVEGNPRNFIGILHMSEDVRVKINGIRLHEDFLYKGPFSKKDTYRMFPYEKEELSQEQVVSILKNVLYYLQPKLQEGTLAGTSSKELKDDPNEYKGRYILNNGKEYVIIKYRDQFKLFEQEPDKYVHWNTQGQFYQEEINFSTYELSMKHWDLKRKLVNFTNVWLDTDRGVYEEFLDVEWKLKMELEIDKAKNPSNFPTMQQGLEEVIHFIETSEVYQPEQVHFKLKELVSKVEANLTGCFYEKTALDYVRNLTHAAGLEDNTSKDFNEGVKHVLMQVNYMSRQ